MPPLAKMQLTEKQRAFVRFVADGVAPRLASKLAGYEADMVDTARILESPRVQSAIREVVSRKLFTEGAPLAYKVLVEVLNSPKAQHRDKIAAAKTILDRAGFIAPAASKATNAEDKPLHEMTTAELRARAERLAQEISGRAVTVIEGDSTPVEEGEGPQLSDLLG